MTDRAKGHSVKRKRSKQKNKKIPRENILQYKAKSDSAGTITIDKTESGAITSEHFSSGSTVTASYKRKSGKPKRTAEVYLHGKDFYLEIDRNIVNQYDYIIAIDTNTVSVSDYNLSVCSSAYTTTKLYDGAKKADFDLAPFIAFASRGSISNPERICWHIFITQILPTLNIENTAKICFVVDSELEHHAAYNSQKKPYFKSHFLPDQIKISYASSEKPDWSINKIMKFCDQSSSEVINQLKNENLDLIFNKTPGYISYLVITPTKEKITEKTRYPFYQLNIENA